MNDSERDSSRAIALRTIQKRIPWVKLSFKRFRAEFRNENPILNHSRVNSHSGIRLRIFQNSKPLLESRSELFSNGFPHRNSFLKASDCAPSFEFPTIPAPP